MLNTDTANCEQASRAILVVARDTLTRELLAQQVRKIHEQALVLLEQGFSVDVRETIKRESPRILIIVHKYTVNHRSCTTAVEDYFRICPGGHALIFTDEPNLSYFRMMKLHHPSLLVINEAVDAKDGTPSTLQQFDAFLAGFSFG